MKKTKYLISMLALILVLAGCSLKTDEPTETPEPDQQVVQTAKEGDYEMLYPFVSSPLRQVRTIGSKEVEATEIGRRLIDKSKKHFSTDNYFLSEGQLIDTNRYFELLVFRSDDNPNGLMEKYEDGLAIDGVTLVNPVFISDIFELNFHKKGSDEIDGVSVALVLKRYQVLDEQTGAMHALSDDALYNIGQTLGLQMGAYLRSIEGMMNVPLHIALYVQSSDIDNLPGNYLPGYYIGSAFSKESTMNFSREQEQWLMLTSNKAQEMIPEIVSQFSLLKRKITSFTGDESVGVIGKVFIADNTLEIIRLEVNVPSKTFLETYGLAQYISQELEDIGSFGVSVKVNIDVYDTTRAVIIKNPNDDPILEVFE